MLALRVCVDSCTSFVWGHVVCGYVLFALRVGGPGNGEGSYRGVKGNSDISFLIGLAAQKPGSWALVTVTVRCKSQGEPKFDTLPCSLLGEKVIPHAALVDLNMRGACGREDVPRDEPENVRGLC